ncbi:MAG: UbiA family prenyltransferase [Planctomycetota bacterium]
MIAGHVLAGGRGEDPRTLGFALLGSACLYLSGMAFNDVADRNRDATERPDRPLPSGRVPVVGAVLLAASLWFAGITAAYLAASVVGAVAVPLASVILLYDFGLKRTPFGPIAMGLCRTLNVFLGAVTYTDAWVGDGGAVWGYAVVLGLYVAAVTAAARFETTRVPRLWAWAMVAATVAMLVCLAVLAGTRPFAGYGSAGVVPGAAAMTLSFAAVAFGARTFLHPAKRLLSPVGDDATPRTIGRLVRSIAWFDAIAVVAWATVVWPLCAVAGCLCGASYVGRKIPIS